MQKVSILLYILQYWYYNIFVRLCTFFLRHFHNIVLRVIGETGKTWDSFCLPIKRGEETTRRQRTVSRSPFEDDLLDPASTGQYVNIHLIDFDIDLSCF